MKVNDYVRTKKRGFQPPQIARITNMSKDSGYKNEYYIALDRNLIPYYEYHIYEEDVYKSSPNLIDLIEVGDYVNGKRVEWIGYKMYQDNGKECVGIGDKIILFNEFTKDYVGEKDVKTIVTKEQMKEMEYRVK